MTAPLLEREPMLAALGRCLADAAAGTGWMVLVSGTAGAGKTSLARTFAQRHADRAQVYWGSCDDLGTPTPLGPLLDIARECPGIAGLLASGRPGPELFPGLLDILVSPSQPMVLVFEDVHWADGATLDLLVYLARRIGSARAVVVVTYRDDGLGPDHPMRIVLGRLATAPRVRRLHLPPLSPSATAQLVAALAPEQAVDPVAAHRLTGGNPFYLVELLQAPPGTLPETVRDAVLARAASLGPAARAALSAVAVVPGRAELALVAAVTGAADLAGVDECGHAGLLEIAGQQVSFRHELARQAVAAATPATKLPRLHAAALAYLAAQPGTDPARLAYHADLAGDRSAVLAHAPVAAAQASHLGAHWQAAAHYERALQHPGALPGDKRAELLERYAEQCNVIGKTQQAIEAFDWVAAYRQEQGDVAGYAQAAARRAILLVHTDTGNREAYDQAAKSVAMVEGLPASPAVAATYAFAAFLQWHDRDVVAAERTAQQAVELAERFGITELLAAGLLALGGSQWLTAPDRAEETLARAAATAQAAGHAPLTVGALGTCGEGAFEVRRFATADTWLANTVDWCEQRDLDHPRNYFRARQAESAFWQGQWSRAAEITAELATPAALAHRPTRVLVRLVTGRLAVRRGDPDQTAPLAEAWDLTVRSGDVTPLWAVAAGRAEAAWHAGRVDQIPELVADAYRVATARGHPWAVGELAYWLWRARALPEPPAIAAEPYAHHIRGDYAAAAAAWEALGCPYEAAMARADGDDPALLRAALAELYRLGARPAANRLVHRLRRLGVTDLPRRPHRRTGANPAGLTDRELEVAELLTAGLHNADIAHRLHISPRTAGHHVAAILAKLGVPTRQAVAGALAAGRPPAAAAGSATGPVRAHQPGLVGADDQVHPVGNLQLGQ